MRIPGSRGDESIQLKTAGRWIASLSLLISPFFLRRKLNAAVTLGVYSGIFVLVLYAVFWDLLPDCYVPGGGMTPFEQLGRAISCVAFIAVAGLLVRKRSEFDPRVFHLLLAALVASAASEFASAIAIDFNGSIKVAAHLLEVVSLYLIYAAFVEVGLKRPYDVIFRNLKASAERLRLHVQQSSLAAIEWDTDFRVVAWNPAAERIFGYTAEEAAGQHWTFLVPFHARPKVDDVWVRLAEGHVDAQCINENLTKDGRTILCDWHNTPLMNAAGEFVCVASLAEDITERKQAEEEQTLTTQRMEALLAITHMTDRPMDEIIAAVVEDAVRLTGSEIGYLALLNEDESVLTMRYWSKSACAGCGIVDKPVIYPVEETGLWGEAIRQRTPVITNDYAAPNPHKHGTPQGHVPVVRHMNVPVFDGQRIVAVAGVGNKGADYDHRDLRQLQLLMDGWWRITMRRQLESELQKNEVKYKALFESSSDALLLRSPDRTLISANRTAVALFGCESEEDLARHVATSFYPEHQPDGVRSQEKVLMVVERTLRNGSYAFEWKYRRKDGSEFLADVLWTKIELMGELLLLATIRDVTEQRRMEEALRAGERRLRFFAENASDVIWTMDFSGRFTYISPSGEQILGYRWEEDMSLTLGDILTPASLATACQTIEEVAAAAAAGRPVAPGSLELEIVRQDGSTVWADVTFSGMYDEAGRMVAIQGITRDISDRKQAEQRQARLLRQLKGINRLQEELLLPGALEEKFNKVTKTAVELLDLDFCRIWTVEPGDLCRNGCVHAATPEGPNACRRRDKCLHMMASSGRYTHTDGGHRRVPFGAYTIGRIASGETNKFLTNSVTTDPHVGDHEWAKGLGLVSFAGYKLHDANGNPLGVLAMFAKHPVSEEDDAFMRNLAETTSRVILRHRAADLIAQESAKLRDDLGNGRRRCFRRRERCDCGGERVFLPIRGAAKQRTPRQTAGRLALRRNPE